MGIIIGGANAYKFTIGASFAPLIGSASYAKSGALLAVVQARVDAASAYLTKAHALAGWDSG